MQKTLDNNRITKRTSKKNKNKKMERSLLFEKKRNSKSNPYEDEKSHALKNQGLQKIENLKGIQ